LFYIRQSCFAQLSTIEAAFNILVLCPSIAGELRVPMSHQRIARNAYSVQQSRTIDTHFSKKYPLSIAAHLR
jgi:hypothetical protein